MKQEHMIAKTILMTVNVLFALYLFSSVIAMGKVQQQTTYYALKMIYESGALDTNALSRYISSARDTTVGYDPMTSLRTNGCATVQRFDYVVVPALCVLLANVIVMGFYWKRRPDQRE